MNMNNHIYIIIHFIVLLLLIDTYISYNVQSNITEKFTISKISGQQLICLIINLCKLCDHKIVENNLSPKAVHNIVQLILYKNQKNLQNFFTKTNKSINIQDTVNVFKNKQEKYNELFNYIDKLLLVSDNKTPNKINISEDEIEQQLIHNSESKLSDYHVVTDNIMNNSNSCKRIEGIYLYLLGFYSQNNISKKYISYKSDFLTVIYNLNNLINNDTCYVSHLYNCE